MKRPCDLCGGKGYVKIPWCEYDPRNYCRCERCNGTGEARA